jgi:uridylate kinase
MTIEKGKTTIISLGGSLIVPNGIDSDFLSDFKKLIVQKVEEGHKFILVTGGGMTARNYIEAIGEIDEIDNEDKDWIGIHSTRLNAQLIRTIFKKHAHPRINKNPHDLEDFYISKNPILVAAGWRPGNSTDLIAIMLAKYLGVKRVVNLSNIDYVYDDDPRKNPDAKMIEKISWTDFRKMVGNEWDPGMNVPFDPVASKLAHEEEIEVGVVNGHNFESLENFIDRKEFKGTVIK